MRVWVLASCGGLLALAAYSAEQTITPDPGAAPPEGDDSTQLDAQPALKPIASSPIARPELSPRQGSLAQARLSSRLANPLPIASGPSSDAQTLPQVEQLRERVQRLRAQHGSRLSSAQSLATEPLPAAHSLSAPPRPVLQAAVSQPAEALPVSRSLAPADTVSGLRPLPLPPAVTALPTPLRPNVAVPEVASEPERGLASTSATNLDQVASANLARSYPIAASRHRGYSARSYGPAPVLTTASTGASGDLTVAAAPRLYGAQPEDSAAVATAQASAATPLQEVTSVPPQAEAIPRESAPLASAILGSDAASAAPESAPVTSHHQSGVPSSLRLTPQRLASLTAARAVATHHGQGTVTRLETAIALPESLPLNPAAPRLSAVPSAPVSVSAASSAEAGLEPATAQIPEPEISQTRTPQVPSPALQRPQAQAPALQAAQAQVAQLQSAQPHSNGSTSVHLSQAQLDSLSFVDVHPKSLPADQCLQASGQASSPESDLSAGLADTALALEMDLSKADLSPAASCLERREFVTVPEQLDQPSAHAPTRLLTAN